MITNEDINTLYAYLSEQTLPSGSAIATLYGKITLIKTLVDTEASLRTYGDPVPTNTSNN